MEAVETATKKDVGIFSYENRLLVVCFLIFGLVFLDRLTLPFLWGHISKEMGLTERHLGMLASGLALSWAFSGVVMGYLSDKLNMRKSVLVASVIIFSLCSALSGAVSGFVALIAFRILMGFSEGPVLPTIQSFIAEASQPHRRGLNMGLVNGVGPGLIGAILGPPIMIGLATAYGWRNAFYISAIPGLILAFLAYKTIREMPSTGKEEIQAANLGADGLTVKNVKYSDLFKVKNITLCVFISCFYITWFIGLLTFTPIFLMKARGFAEADMGLVMSSVGFAWVFWSFVIPALSDRLGRKPVFIFFSAVATTCPYFLSTVTDPVMLRWVMFFTFTGLGCFTLFMATIPSETVSKTLIATSLGLIMGVGEVVGGGIVPFAAGFAAEQYGLNITMWIAGVGAGVATLLAFFLDETAPVKVGRK